ncbi:MAG: 1-deoxy-D-xylulose-5-phosphate reductoisomerase [Pseudomonadales bacterium]
MQLQQVTILGATGSIGVNTLDVIAQHPDRYNVYALTANTNWQLLAEQCAQFKPARIVLREDGKLALLQQRLEELGCHAEILTGTQGLVEVASSAEVDVVMAAIVGGAGLEATLAAASSGKKLLLANKESLVMSGRLFMETVKDNGATLLPIDSEHNAIFQCLANGASDHAKGVRKILLTGSGGPLLREPVENLKFVTPDQACAHPNWKMGRKISVDSASMMNKGLEFIEACWLFAVQPEKVEVVIHPQSLVHSMVEYIDGSVVAQLGNPDMRTPIAHGLAWPDRIESGVPGLDFTGLKDLHFEPVDMDRYPCLRLCQEIATKGQSYAIALNASNEIAVSCYLDELISFTDIPIIIEAVLEETSDESALTIECILALDEESRARASEMIGKIKNT